MAFYDSVQRHFEVIQCTCLKMTCITTKACRRAKQSEIWYLGVVVITTCMWDIPLAF